MSGIDCCEIAELSRLDPGEGRAGEVGRCVEYLKRIRAITTIDRACECGRKTFNQIVVQATSDRTGRGAGLNVDNVVSGAAIDVVRVNVRADTCIDGILATVAIQRVAADATIDDVVAFTAI